MSEDILGYRGKRVVVMGCFSGTGEACARQLVALGAEVHGADIRPSPVAGLASFNSVDLKDPASIAAGIAAIGGEIDGLFNISGLPQTFPGEDVVTVNFLGIRQWTDGWLPRMRRGGAIVTVSSLGGMNYLARQPLLAEFLGNADIAAGRAWYLANAERAGDPYTLSKEAVNTWTQKSAPGLMERDIRINCTMPSPIDTPMLNDFRKVAGDAVLSAFARAKGRFSSPEEQALPLILLNSDAASFISGVCLAVDAGLSGGLATGVLNLQEMIAEAMAKA
ncbi:NAD(P)-dependent dehydrogenase (short-subunit alcohol dehydrogenase family) [Novosphingobium kunmingense]|uniref:NAD(P)-dependent dehydrogenase (Short-subunit alcohol dehydrogenase family) n=1 Tax=Novosphingobium kunmingense TaxID=1211806 RepID=A0A2N0H5Z7_9SPHN|nr:coniferyl-alcohol dehydrogenase [Novosphingobium kunmingense]PKB14359.1 NAD(P)-dependent dehydrogenase (short-subunit alcohol dehydrogenase family) [Novosphingobium kunmingense]